MKHSAPVPCDLRAERAVVGRVLVDALVALDLQPDLLGRQLDVLGQAGAVDLLVVEDVGRGAALLLGERGQRGALVGVLGQHAGVGALRRSGSTCPARRARPPGSSEVMPTAVLPGLTCAIPASLRIGSDTRRRAGVELADVADRRRRPEPALRALADVAPGSQPPAWAVESSSDSYSIGNLPALPPRLLERELGAVDRGHRLRPRRALQRQARVDRQRLRPLTAAAATAAVLVLTARSNSGRQGHDDDQSPHRGHLRPPVRSQLAWYPGGLMEWIPGRASS